MELQPNLITELNFKTLLKQFFPEQKLFKEFNPIEEIFVDKTYCFTCDKEHNFPTMYFTESAYGCYNCGHRGNPINFLKNIIEYTPKEIAIFLLDNQKLSIDDSKLEFILDEILEISTQDVHDIFDEKQFSPGTACLDFGGPRDYAGNLKDYISIRKDIWKIYLPEEQERRLLKNLNKINEEKDLNEIKKDDLPF